MESYGRLYAVSRRHKRGAEQNLTTYFDLLSLFSALIDADKIHAARVVEAERASLPEKAVDRYRALNFGLPRGLMDTLRENLYRTVVERISRASLEQRLFTLTAPTGTGKTLAGFAAGFRMRERIAKVNGVAPRIIYALPFTSIIDQTFTVGEEVLRAALPAPEAAVPTSWLLKHHHLAEPRYQGSGAQDPERSLDESLLLIESWQSEIVITTFVQLFHTLVGYENRMLKKFHRLGGAVVILDEVQNIPVEYWPLVADTLRQACARLDLRVILMTATRPEWFSPGEALELAGDTEAVRRRFAALNRVTVTAETAPCTTEEAAAAFLQEYDQTRSYLVILNTIKSSITFYQELRRACDKQVPLYYLSANIVPAERERRLQAIRAGLYRNKKPVLVSTQVVEAGVDLNFDEVWRDLGPVDAVVQAAGRCNRHFVRERGRVRLIHLVDKKGENYRSLASFVYGKIHAVAARRLFAERAVLDEPAFFDAVADYFRIVREAMSTRQSEEILRAMANLFFTKKAGDEQQTSVSDFALIRELPRYIQVFVCADAAAENIWEHYQSTVLSECDIRRRREAFLTLKRDFRRYIISVPGELLVSRLGGGSRPLVIPPYLLDEFYDSETGFKRFDDEGIMIF
jgi:CRISPR-associated endonuclease/helicase Cas3